MLSLPQVDDGVVQVVYNVFDNVAGVFEGLSGSISDKGDMFEGVGDGLAYVLGGVSESV